MDLLEKYNYNYNCTEHGRRYIEKRYLLCLKIL